jgi:hypothetical protein
MSGHAQARSLTRRGFMAAGLGGAATALLHGRVPATQPVRKAPSATRGVVLWPGDLSLRDWPERARAAGLTTVAIHHGSSPQAVVQWTRSDAGQHFLEQCAKLRLQVEYELHAMSELLPRGLFAKAPEMFRMDEQGQRQANSNCCVHSSPALDVICENAVKFAKALRPTTGRYFYWGDDGQPWCRCAKCKELSPAEQAVTIENRMVGALAAMDPGAQVAHLAYLDTLLPPRKVKPDKGVFLEYAPIKRSYDIPYAEQHAEGHDGLNALDLNLEVFPRETAQVLEYWLDMSRFSNWQRPTGRIPWKREVFLADVKTYRQRGIRHITTFAAWVDAEYQKEYGDLGFISEYGQGLAAAPAAASRPVSRP